MKTVTRNNNILETKSDFKKLITIKSFPVFLGCVKTKTSKDLSDSHYRSRSIEKNALSHSSQQSLLIDSYESIKKNYNKALGSSNLKKCPDFWGGYSFTPYYFEFWEGHDSRLNKRDVYEMKNGNWQNYILQP